MYKKNNKNRIFLAVLVFLCMFVYLDVPVYAADTPKVILESYSVAEGTFEKGEKSIIKLKLKNTHKSLNAENLLLTYKCETNSVYSTFGNSNQIFIENIKAEDTVEKNIELTVSSTTKDESIPIVFCLSYIDEKTKETIEENFMIYIPINGMSFIDSVSVASSATIGAQTYISANLNNSSYTDAYDIKMIVDGDVTTGNEKVGENGDGKVTFDLGDIMNGEINYNENSIIFNHSGQQNIRITFEYKDKSGEKHTEVAGDYTVNVIEKESVGNNNVVNVADNEISFTWLACIACGFVAAIIMVILAIKSKKK